MGPADWIVLTIACAVSLFVGLYFSRKASRRGAEGYFAGGRKLKWWAVGFSNTATYQSGSGGFVMLVLFYGLVGNWLWWASWIIWMPLVAVIWARLWRRMRIITTAELITLRYGGRPAAFARKVYAFVCCFGFSVLIIGYITGFFAKTIAPLVPLSELEILLLFGGVTAVYTVFGGLTGVVFTDVVQFLFMVLGAGVLFFLAASQHGDWAALLDKVEDLRPDALTQSPVAEDPALLTILLLVIQGFFFAGSPTAGEGMTAQRFMAAKDERHAMGGQLFNAFLALSFRTIPLIGLGIIGMSLFWTRELAEKTGGIPEGMILLDEPAHAYAEVIKHLTLPAGFVGLLVAVEAAAFMSTLSSALNWGGSFIVNDFYRSEKRPKNERRELLVGRLTTLALFILAGTVAVLFVEGMVSWFLFINSIMVIFLLPLSWLRFFWWRFNVWGELAATLCCLPFSILIWFVLGFKEEPPWKGMGLLFLLSIVVLLTVSLLTPPESEETLRRFWNRCRPPGLWGRYRQESGPPMKGFLLDGLFGILACLGMVLATNAVFVQSWLLCSAGIALAVIFGGLLIRRYGLESST